MAEGVVLPIAIGLAGVLLLILRTFSDTGAVKLSYLFVLLAVAWMFVIAAVVRGYSQALPQRERTIQ